MTYKGKTIRFERITTNTFDVFYGDKLIGTAVETKETAKFYAIPEWKYPIYKAPTKTIAVGAFLQKNL